MKIYNILWLKILNGSVKQHPFTLAKNSSAHSNPFYVSLNANELCSPQPVSSVGWQTVLMLLFTLVMELAKLARY